MRNPDVSAAPEMRFSRGAESVRIFGRAVLTLFVTPDHKRLYREIAKHQYKIDVPLNPPIDHVVSSLREYVLPEVRTFGNLHDMPSLLGVSGLLMQFSDHLRTVPEDLCLEYDALKEVFDHFVELSGALDRPLSYDEQLAVALDVSDACLEDALWKLFTTSRFYARWLDGKVVRNIPEFSDSKKIEIMEQWQSTLMASKSGSQSGYHDAAGDTYYTWTHAVAMYYTQALADNTFAKVAEPVFRRGTTIMQTCVNNLNPRGIVSAHDTASLYGNAIGDICAQYALLPASVNSLR